MHLEAALGRAVSGTSNVIGFSGNWINELGSIAALNQTGDSLAGTYESAVSDDGTRTSGTLSGWVDGNLIAFTIHWDEFQAITSWVGQQLSADTNPAGVITTLWQMTKTVDPGDEWASINARRRRLREAATGVGETEASRQHLRAGDASAVTYTPACAFPPLIQEGGGRSWAAPETRVGSGGGLTQVSEVASV